jgi:hypothetical protein
LDIYVTGKCLWNPDLDRQKLLDNFYTEYFGPAAPAMKQFYGRIEDVWVHGDHGGRNYYCSKDASSFDKIIKTGFVSANPWKCLFTPPILKELAGYLEKAKKQAKDAPYRDRVEWVGKGFAFTLKCAAPLQ